MSSDSQAYNKWVRALDKRSLQFSQSIVQREQNFESNRVAWGIPYNSPETIVLPSHSFSDEKNIPLNVQMKWRRLQYVHPLLSSILRASFIAYQGELGMGKTLAAIEHYKLLKSIDQRFILYTNVKIKDKSIQYRPIDWKQILLVGLYGKPFEDERVVVNLDEIQNFVDSRLSLSHINRIFSNFASQIRKRKSKLTYTGSSAALGDIRLRDLTKYIVIASKRELFDPKRECDDSECMGRHLFIYKVYKPLQSGENKYIGKFVMNPTEAKRTLEQFDSFDVPAPIDTMSSDMVDRVLNKLESFGERKPVDNLSELGAKPVFRPKVLDLG